jgi:hypothetical protein
LDLMSKTAFQVVELTLDADQNVSDRRAIPYPYPTRNDAVHSIEKVLLGFSEYGYQPEGDFWWAVTGDGKAQVRFVIERL